MPTKTRAKQPTRFRRVPSTNHLMCHCGRHAICKGTHHSSGTIYVWWECSKGHYFQETFYPGNNVVEMVK